MHKIIASFKYSENEISPECYNVFVLGVNVIEKEFHTIIHCDIRINKQENIVELRLLDATLQDWFKDMSCRETIIYKLSTHFKICLEHFAGSSSVIS